MSALDVLLVEDDPATVSLVESALQPWGDAIVAFATATDAMALDDARLDVALIDLDVQRGAGLALVHFLRAKSPDLPIVALIPPGDAETAMVAQSLGVNYTVPKPVTGDSLLVSLGPVREKKAARARAAARRSLVPLAGVLTATDSHALAESLARSAADLTGGTARAVIEDAREGEVVAIAGATGEPDETLPLVAHDESIGTLYFASRAPRLEEDPSRRRSLDQLALTAATVGALLRRLDSVAHTGIKDPQTSAYTFAYFVDVAGREIERARRYDRRFGLLTFLVENYTELRTTVSVEELREARRELVDTILDAVRDSDVLAHVEDDELYLLLPETGMLGAITCRRRIAERHGRRAELARLEGRASTLLTIGIATFPRDGRDLASLLKAAHVRGNASRGSAATQMLRETTGGLEAMLGSLLRFRPDDASWHTRQAALPADTVATLAASVAREASQTTGPSDRDGVFYIMGPRQHPLVRGAYDVLRVAPADGVPSYWLKPRALDGETSSQGARLSPAEIEVDGGRIGPFAVLIALTEGWTWACVASDHGDYMRVLHTCDLELVEVLIAELQTTFHLQRGLE